MKNCFAWLFLLFLLLALGIAGNMDCNDRIAASEGNSIVADAQ